MGRGTQYSGSRCFRALFREDSYNMPSDYQAGLSERLQTFQVVPGTTYDAIYQQWFVLLDEIRSVEGTLWA